MDKEQKPAEFQFIGYASHPVLTQCISLLQKDEKRQIKILSTSKEVIKTHKENPKILFVYYLDHLKRIKDLHRVVNYLKIHKPTSQYLICVVGTVQHPKLQELLNKFGCQDYISLNNTPKSVRLKLKRIIERLDLDQEELRRARFSERTALTGKVTRIGPFESQYDYWSYKKWSSFKKVMGQWIFEMTGPSPNVGRWLEPDTEGEWSDGCYWWTPHDLEYPLFKGQTGIWIFKSKTPPEHKVDIWSFVGLEPELFYLDPVQKNPRYKVKTLGDGNLEVGANSKAAESLAPLISKTYEYAVKVKVVAAKGETELSTDEVKEIEQIIFEIDVDESNETLEDDVVEAYSSEGSKADPFIVFDKQKEEKKPDILFSKDIFKRVEDAKMQESYFSESEKNSKTSVLWTHGKKHLVQVKSTRFDPKTKTIYFQLIQSPELLDLFDQINEQTVPSVYYNVTLPRSAVFLNMASKDLKVVGTTIEYSFQNEMYQIQRRKDFRYEFTAQDQSQSKKLIHQKIRVTFDGKTDTYLVADISASGIRVYIPNEIATTWKQGVTLQKVELSVGGRPLQSEALIRWVKKLPVPHTAGTHQVGAEFTTLSGEDQKWINDQILKELNDYFKSFPI